MRSTNAKLLLLATAIASGYALFIFLKKAGLETILAFEDDIEENEYL